MYYKGIEVWGGFFIIYLQHAPLQSNTTCSSFLVRQYFILFTPVCYSTASKFCRYHY